MKTPVLRAVTSPPMMFWVPYKIAVINVSLIVFCWIAGVVIFDLNPLIFITLLLGVHGFLVSISAREPHLDTLLEAWSFKQKRTKNLIIIKANKFTP